MAIRKLSRLTVSYLEAESEYVEVCRLVLEDYLCLAGNTSGQIKFWLDYCLNLEGDEDGNLKSVVATDAILAILEGDLTMNAPSKH